MNANPSNGQRPWWEIWGTAIGGWATALALIASIITFTYAYRAQEKFNRDQLDFIAVRTILTGSSSTK
jgi:hypothetical protein